MTDDTEPAWTAPEWIKQHKDDMETFYSNGVWGGCSVAGSNAQQTLQYRAFLQQFFRDYQVRSVLDIGCGDWQYAQLMDWTGIDYTGVDVVPAVIRHHQQAYARENIRFIHADATAFNLPDADLVIIKDVLQHWSNDTVLSFLPRLDKFPYVLFVNGYHGVNGDCDNGDTRPINIQEPPFSLDVECVQKFQGKRIYLKKNPPR